MYFVRVPIHFTIYWQSRVHAPTSCFIQAVSRQISDSFRQSAIHLEILTKSLKAVAVYKYFTSVCRQFTASFQPVDRSLKGSPHASTGCPQTHFLFPAVYRGGHANFFFKVRKSQIHKFLGSFCNRKAANFWGVPVRESQISKFLMFNLQIATSQISTKYCTTLKIFGRFWNDFLLKI
jgi:hypothetical protein